MCAVTVSAAPKLTVFAIVDGLDVQSMQDLRTYWSQGGLRTLSEEAYQTTVTFPQVVYGGDETTATLLTGETPFYHTWQSDCHFRRSDRTVRPMLLDERQKGINSQETLSPAGFPSMTLADRHRLNEGAKAKIYAIGINPVTTVLLAGHAANACCWIEDGGWGTTAYFSEGLPTAADRMNTQGDFAGKTNTTWTNRMSMPSYLRPTAIEQKRDGFSYDVKDHLRHSPVANTLVINLALDMQKEEKLGQRGQNDLLLLHLTLVSPKTASARIASAEQEEMYIRLNQDLGYLMEQLQRRMNKSDFRIVLVGKPCYGNDVQQLQSAGMPTTRFNIDRAAALTGTYLMAIYGHERWVDGGYGNAIYLNRTLIEQKKLPLETIRRQVADFLVEMEGVQAAYPVTDVPLLQGDGEMEKLRNTTGRYAGDVVLMLTEGTTLMLNDKQSLDRVIEREPQVPLLLWTGAYRTFPDLPSPLPATRVAGLLAE